MTNTPRSLRNALGTARVVGPLLARALLLALSVLAVAVLSLTGFGWLMTAVELCTYLPRLDQRGSAWVACLTVCAVFNLAALFGAGWVTVEARSFRRRLVFEWNVRHVPIIGAAEWQRLADEIEQGRS